MKISIIMPSLNVRPYIEECIESAIRQTLEDIEVICVDAGSTDGTWEILEKYVQNDSRVHLYHSSIKSYGYQVNFGIDKARGDYVAILETDDYLDESMYEKLYQIAIENNADYVKSDFYRFFVLDNGEKVLTKYPQFPFNPELYFTKMNPHICDEVYQEDFNLWKGIYNTKWLKEHRITLNETPGAAYQDIGFMEQVYLYAKVGVYSNEPLYYYRTDREEASVNSIKGLKNLWVEFKRVYELFVLENKGVYERGFFIHMIRGFIGEFDKLIPKIDGCCTAPECEPYLSWFIKVIRNAFEEKIIDKSAFSELNAKKIIAIINDPQGYADAFIENKKKYEIKLRFLNDSLGKEVVLFGAGHWGIEILRLLDIRGGVVVKAFADNSTDKQGTMIANYPVYSLEECLVRFPEARYIITNDNNRIDMKRQFEKCGGNTDCLVVALGDIEGE